MAERELKNQENTEVKNNKSGLSVVGFADGTKEELAKVVWPSRQQLLSESAAVILMVILVATTISLVDKFFVWVAGKVF